MTKKRLLSSGIAEITVTPVNKEVADEAGATFTLSCNISGLTAEVTEVVWKKNGTNVTTLTDGATYTPDTGGGSYDNKTGTQISTLTVSGSDSARDDMEFICVVTEPGDPDDSGDLPTPSSDDPTTVNSTVYLKFYSEYYEYDNEQELITMTMFNM